MMNHVPSTARQSPYIQYLLPIGILLLALGARLIPGPRTIDDAYITFRYARDILAGNGFVFNPGEHVLGTTTPLYTILLTGLGVLYGGVNAPFPQFALVTNALADALTCLLLVDLGRLLGSRRAGLGAALVWAIAPFSVTFAIGGLETSVYVLLLTAMVDAHLRERHTLAALLAALALLTRPDALILLGPLAVDRLFQVIREKGIKGQGLLDFLAFLAPTLAWITFATVYFGSPLPHSIAAKSLAYRLPGNAALVRLLQHYATPFLEHLTFGVPAIAVGLVLYPFLFLVGARRALHANGRIWPFLAYPWLYFATFAIANPLIFRWYLTPPLPAYFLTILLGADQIVESFLGRERQEGRFWRESRIAQIVPLFVLILTPVGLSLKDWTLHPDHGLERPAPRMAWYQLELLYRQAADSLLPDLNAHIGSPPILAAGDVGVLGYFTPTRILDTVGLNSPQSTQYYPLDSSYYVTNYAIPPRLILDAQPDYVVILEVYGRNGLLKDPEFQREYRLRLKIPTDIYGSDGMLVFMHK